MFSLLKMLAYVSLGRWLVKISTRYDVSKAEVTHPADNTDILVFVLFGYCICVILSYTHFLLQRGLSEETVNKALAELKSEGVSVVHSSQI